MISLMGNNPFSFRQGFLPFPKNFLLVEQRLPKINNVQMRSYQGTLIGLDNRCV
ncbi:uncharacterized protein SPAPADRAFT_58004 [Spathaspora passalidarum NRRL Y-27907]|uniref:Uncharacterized protein n=1 Tax=Spathaspora passalidarum (strain NRRL Y-27907 / 11-Y1) TaxID=619300 RepID=G3AF89_SPAPN|nr:uncharacterized protein SPAPADRAFT_58004 [Spathaspora passalidarum NRRL Y-27907]EGW34878.1 hypothetical protein SPAPADRAFT_58004 [Spathaspora passalidarum NRRL Y-27907]